MNAPAFDPRLTPAREDLAAIQLQGDVAAPRYVEGQRYQVRVPVARLHRRPDHNTSPDTELLFGEEIDIFDISDGWAWGQSRQDGYVGYVPESGLSRGAPQPTHRVQTLQASIYHSPSLKTPTYGALGFGSLVHVIAETEGYAKIDGTGAEEEWLARPQIRPLLDPEPDWVAVAERFLGIPYIWGGRSGQGLDCSGLVQLALQAAGHDCPRDSDMQRAGLGRTLGGEEATKRGDLIFWRGHVGIVSGPNQLLHANAHHMRVATEPLDAALERIGKAEFGQVTRRARLDA